MTSDQLERILRTITQAGGGLVGGVLVQHNSSVHMTSLTGSAIILMITLVMSVIMNCGPKILRPYAGEVEKILEQQEASTNQPG